MTKDNVKIALACFLTVVYCAILAKVVLWPPSEPIWLAFTLVLGAKVFFPLVRDLFEIEQIRTLENCVRMIRQRVPRRFGGDVNSGDKDQTSATLVPSIPEK